MAPHLPLNNVRCSNIVALLIWKRLFYAAICVCGMPTDTSHALTPYEQHLWQTGTCYYSGWPSPQRTTFSASTSRPQSSLDPGSEHHLFRGGKSIAIQSVQTSFHSL